MTTGPYANPLDPATRCPRCGGALVRVRRRPLDRLASLLSLRWRYRCRALGCGWEGTVVVKRRAGR